MAKRANVFRQQVTVFVNGTVSRPALRARFVQAARSARDGLIADGRAPDRYTTSVDGVIGRDENLADRTIYYQFEFLTDVIYFALDYLYTRAPYGAVAKTGIHLRDSLRVSIDDALLPRGRPDIATLLEATKDAKAVYIFADLPYARKADIQMIGRTAMTYSTPPFMYADAVAAVRRQFGNTVRASRIADIQHVNTWVRKVATKSTSLRRYRPGEGIGKLTQTPALVINPMV